MRQLVTLSILLISLSACKDGSQTRTSQTKDISNTTSTTAATPPYTSPAGVDPKVATSISGIVNGYLRIKNALVRSNSKEAAAGGAEMVAAIGKVDMSAMNEAQMNTYHSVIDDLKEHAEHVNHKAGDIAHQREHFETMSADIEDLVKTFGGGRKLYKDFCPMAADGKGASWVSEMKEIRNPYYGEEMLECGEVKEEL